LPNEVKDSEDVMIAMQLLDRHVKNPNKPRPPVEPRNKYLFKEPPIISKVAEKQKNPIL
jgi:hypothetical protein